MIFNLITGILSYDKKIEILKSKYWYKRFMGNWVHPNNIKKLHPIKIIFMSIEEIIKI